MAEPELNVDSLIGRLLEGKFTLSTSIRKEMFCGRTILGSF